MDNQLPSFTTPRFRSDNTALRVSPKISAPTRPYRLGKLTWQQERRSRTSGFLFVRVIARTPRCGLVTGRTPPRSDPLVAGYY